MAAQRDNKVEEHWFLRVNGNATFGPVTEEGLILWAEQGRILPGHEVSGDQKKWLPAASLACLDMRWYILVDDDEPLGPLNRLAAEALLESGKVPQGARIVSADELTELESEEPAAPQPAGYPASTPATADKSGRELARPLAALEDEVAALKDAVSAGRETIRSLEARCTELQQQLDAARSSLEAGKAEVRNATEERLKLEHHLLETRAALTQSHSDLHEATEELQSLRQSCQSHELHRSESEARLQACESELAEVLNNSNAREIEYREKIAQLEKTSMQSPEATVKFFADQQAIYDLINAELADLTLALEKEKELLEETKQWSARRQEALYDRHQKLLRHVGTDLTDMTQRTLREQGADPRVARMRAELENLRITYEREAHLAEVKEREWQEKFRLQEAVELRLRKQVFEGEKRVVNMQELEESLQQYKRELVNERKARDQERAQLESNLRTLLNRIEELERIGNRFSRK